MNGPWKPMQVMHVVLIQDRYIYLWGEVWQLHFLNNILKQVYCVFLKVMQKRKEKLHVCNEIEPLFERPWNVRGSTESKKLHITYIVCQWFYLFYLALSIYWASKTNLLSLLYLCVHVGPYQVVKGLLDFVML
jgi:hypothetical protein